MLILIMGVLGVSGWSYSSEDNWPDACKDSG